MKRRGPSSPPTLAAPARRSSDWRPPSACGLGYGEGDYQSLDLRAPGRGRRQGSPAPPSRSRRCLPRAPPVSSPTSEPWPPRPDRPSPSPHTRHQASAEIDRLKHAPASPRAEVAAERKAIADHIATGPDDSTRVRDHEVTGWGSSATWTQHRGPAQPANQETPRRRTPVVGPRTELGRYTVPAGDRILYGRIDGVVRVIDRPAGTPTPQARAYLVERGLESKTELDAVIADYLATAAELDDVPMAVNPVAVPSETSS